MTDEINATMSGAQEGAVASPGPEAGADNPSDGGQPGVVAPEGNNDGGADPTPEGGEGQPQSRADNQAARLARLATERQARERITQAQAQALAQAQQEVNAELARMSLKDPDTGEDIADLKGLRNLADRLEAQRRNIPPETFAELRQAKAENQALQQQLDGLRAADQERRRADDLAAIRAAFPDDPTVKAAKSIIDLGEDFIQMMAAQEGAGMSPDAALTFGLVQGLRQKNAKPVPPAIGSIAAKSGGSGGEFFSEAELDALTQAELLRDPKLREKAEKSMARLYGGTMKR